MAAKQQELFVSGYHPFQDEDGNEYGSFEIFWLDATSDELPEGWYWWACFPGCLPDGEPVGPYETSAEAYANAVLGGK